MPSPSTADEAYPYLRAATAGLRHHTTAASADAPFAPRPVDRLHLDTLHTHLTALHRLLDRLADTTRPPHPAAGRHLGTAHMRLWQAADAVHDAFHNLPAPSPHTSGAACLPERLPDTAPMVTICQRHLAAVHSIRRKTTPSDLNSTSHSGHPTSCTR